MNDPIAELVRALDTDGKPPLAWVVRWSEPGGDPVAAAWARSWSPGHMARLLERAGHAASASARQISRAAVLWSSTDIDRARCDAIRRLVATPPTLAELLAPREHTLAFRAAARAPVQTFATRGA